MIKAVVPVIVKPDQHTPTSWYVAELRRPVIDRLRVASHPSETTFIPRNRRPLVRPSTTDSSSAPADPLVANSRHIDSIDASDWPPKCGGGIPGSARFAHGGNVE